MSFVAGAPGDTDWADGIVDTLDQVSEYDETDNTAEARLTLWDCSLG